MHLGLTIQKFSLSQKWTRFFKSISDESIHLQPEFSFKHTSKKSLNLAWAHQSLNIYNVNEIHQIHKKVDWKLFLDITVLIYVWMNKFLATVCCLWMLKNTLSIQRGFVFSWRAVFNQGKLHLGKIRTDAWVSLKGLTRIKPVPLL